MVPIEEYQVIVCGAGPVGLFLAISLKSQGISVAIVERQRAPYPLPRAVVFDHESRRLLSAVIPKALLEEIMEEVVGKGGQDGSNFVWRDANLKLVADLHWEKPTASGTPFAMGFNQPTLERLLLQHAVEKGIPIHRGFEIYALREGDDTVTLDCSDFAGPGFENNPNPVLAKSFRASYIVGCDGANSTIRKLLAIKSVDLGFENDWLIVDMLPKNGYIPPKVERVGSSQICDPNRPTTLVFGGKGRKRLEFMRLPHETKGDLLRDEKIWELVGAWGFNEDNCAVERRAMYTFNARWATEFWKGRIILAGDALHLMPPFIGQGLNSGFRDAGALAWRLPMLLQGEWSSAALLKSYQTERLEHVRKLTEHCIALGEIVCELDPGKSAKMHDFIRANPGGYDPALGQPGILTTQKEAGHLSWQRPLKAAGSIKATLLDEIYGSCWKLLSLAGTSPPIADQLQPSMKDFFNNLDGKIIEITEAQDVTGDYQTWFTEHIGAEHVVIVRPDFYVFGHAHVREVNTLLESLRAALIA